MTPGMSCPEEIHDYGCSYFPQFHLPPALLNHQIPGKNLYQQP